MLNKIKEAITRFKEIWNVMKHISNIYSEMERIERKINRNTTVHADIGYKGTGSQIIVVGRYKNKDYVRSFNVRTENLSNLIELLREEEKGAGVGKFDMIGAMEFSSVYRNDMF
jgi:hypothetical protein